MTNAETKLVTRHNWLAKKVRYYCFGSTCPKLRIQVIRILEKSVSAFKSKSQMFADDKIEGAANLATTLATMLSSTLNLVKTWQAFHEQRYSDAWHNLMDAQDDARAAMSFSGRTVNLEGTLRSLLHMEQWMFPWQAYFSPALVILEETCSICGAPIDQCDHLPGKLYMGKPCRGRVTRFAATSVSLVEQPADKRCFARNFPAHNGMSRDNFTGRLLSDLERNRIETAILLVSTYMRDFVITDDVLANSFGSSDRQH